MSIAAVAATIALVAIAIVLAVGRFRSHIRLGNAAKRFEKSQRKLSTSLETLSDVVGDVQNQNSLIAEEISKVQVTYGYRYSGHTVSAGCFLCGRWPQRQMTAVASDDEIVYGIHRALPSAKRLVRIHDTPDLQPQPWDHIGNDWIDEWTREHAELDALVAN